MELDMVVERMRLMVDLGDFAALKRMCDSPMLKTIVKITHMAAWETTDGIRQLLKAVPAREAHEIRIDETECDPDLAAIMHEADVMTIGDLEKLSDEELLGIPRVGYDRVLLLRALSTKYLTQSRSKGYREVKGADGKTRGEETRDLHLAIAELLRDKKTPEQIVAELGCKRSIVLLVVRRLRTRAE